VETIDLTILGTPVAKGRPRVTRWGAHTPEATVNYENLVKECYMIQGEGVRLEGALKVSINLFFPIAESTSKKRKKLMVDGGIRPQKKPDADNCIKSICDALNELAYRDDKQIVEVHAHKFYAEQPRAEVVISEMEWVIK